MTFPQLRHPVVLVHGLLGYDRVRLAGHTLTSYFVGVPEALEAKFNTAYDHERLPLCARIPGYIRARRFEAVMGAPKYTTVHEMASLEVWKSQAWDDWRTAVTPVWNSEIRQNMVHAEGSPGVFRRIFPV